MKRTAAQSFHDSYSDRDEQPAKQRRQDSSSTLPIPSKRQQTQQPLSPLSNYPSSRAGKPELEDPTVRLQTRTVSDCENEIFQWIPRPPGDFEVMSQPPSKKSRSNSRDRGRRRSISPSTNASSRDAYKATNYVTILETKGCFMRPSDVGPTSDGLALCQQFLDSSVEPPRNTLFEEKFIRGFHDALQNRSEMRVSLALHPLLVPCAEDHYTEGREDLENVIDGYNDQWAKTEPIFGPKPQPDHSRSLKWSTFTECQRRKLGIKPDEKSYYAVREDMYFPYLTAEIKCGNQALV